MWALRNQTPFPATARFLRDHAGRSFWALWVTATFRLRPGLPPLFTAEQGPPLEAPVYQDDDPAGMLLADSDLTPLRARVDLTLAGHALPPGAGAPQRRLVIGIGTWSRALDLHPARRWTARGEAEPDPEAPPAPVFLGAAAAFGGPGDAGNPLGCGHGGAGDRPAQLGLPGEVQTRAGQRISPALIGPVGRAWPLRARLGGTYDDGWRTRRAPLLPLDFDPAYWQAAPAPQQLERAADGHLAAGRVLTLAGFAATPPDGRAVELPLPTPAFALDARIAGRWHAAAPALQSLHVNIDALTVRLCWLGTWPVASAAEDVAVETTVVSLAGNGGFRVRPDDVPLFGARAPMAEEPA